MALEKEKWGTEILLEKNKHEGKKKREVRDDSISESALDG
jgi:hypothetical protein